MNWTRYPLTPGLLALAGLMDMALAACSGTPEPLTDSLVSGSGAISDAAVPDATASVDAPASLDAGGSTETAPAPAVRYLGRGAGFVLTRDAGAPSEGTGETGDHATDGDASLPPSDASVTTTPSSCAVTFSVTNALVDGLIFQQVVLGGDVPALGSGVDSAALKMTASSVPASTWSTTVTLQDGQTVHFRFGMASTAPSSLIAWETSGNSRSFGVACASSPSSYVGQYGAAPDGG